MPDVERNRFLHTPAPGVAVSVRLSGWRLYAARVAWVLLFAMSLIPLVRVLPGYIASIEHPASDSNVLSRQAIDALSQIGLTLDAYAWLSFVIVCLVVLVSLVIALVLFWRRNDDWMALLVSLFLFVYTASNIGAQSDAPPAPNTTLEVALAIVQVVLPLSIIFGVFLLFPSGRFVPRWSWVIFVAVNIWAVVIGLVPDVSDGLLFLGYPVFIGAAIACMVYRYRRASTPVQRLQTRWVVFGLVITLLANQAFWIPTGFTPLGQTLYAPLALLAYQLILVLVPITFFIAIQRYRLYEIDTIINRALVYGALTVILAAIYVVGVAGAHTLIAALTNNSTAQEPVVIVATTLLIAALFRPLRARLQAGVDRRFYRSKYDAAKTLAAFSATLRQDVNLELLQEHLLDVVEQTMRPAHASVLLLPPKREAAERSRA